MARFEIHYRDGLTLFVWVASCDRWGGKRCDCRSLAHLGRGLWLCLLLIARGVQTSTSWRIIREMVDRTVMLLVKVLQVQFLLLLTFLCDGLLLYVWWKSGCPMDTSSATSITDVKVIHRIFVPDWISWCFICWKYLLTVRRRVIDLSSALIWHFVEARSIAERWLYDIIWR